MSLRRRNDRISSRPRYGILGGTFDPIHMGHLIAAQAAQEALGLDRVIFIPAGSPPHKQGQLLTDARSRLRMVKLAIAGNSRFRTSDIELRSLRPSYTAYTLRLLKEKHPGIDLYLLMGWDQAILLDSWKRPEEIFRLAKVVVLGRPGYDPQDIPQRWKRLAISIDIPGIDISSSLIRNLVRERREIRYLVPEAVRRFILQQGLYR